VRSVSCEAVRRLTVTEQRFVLVRIRRIGSWGELLDRELTTPPPLRRR
jgi:hypothetical protein